MSNGGAESILMATSIGRTGADLQFAIADWLLNSKVRVRSGTHAGGIAGWLNEHGEPEFVYPEIAGYYLSWLAAAAALHHELNVCPAATAIIEWLASITSARLPCTRYYFDDRNDWRNGATFTFDLAILCRGLHAIRGLVSEQPRRDLLRIFMRHTLPAGDVLPVYINKSHELPDCWSTRPGPFQLKTAAALLPLQDHPAIWDTYYRWSGRVLEDIDAGDLHAACYALEGLVQFGALAKSEALFEAASVFEVLFADIDDQRSDVIAQALRLGCVLRSLGFLQAGFWNDRLAELRFLLESFIDDSGAVLFRPPCYRPRHLNSWAAIFAYQCFGGTGLTVVI